MESTALWQPDTETVRHTQMARFMAFVNERHGMAIECYADLWQWSIEQSQLFWVDCRDFFGIRGEQGEQILAAGNRFIDSRWFDDSRLNFAENLLYPSLAVDERQPAIIAWLENGRRSELSYAQLRQQVASLANRLVQLGIEPGDRIAAWMPNTAETIIAMLACSSIGAIWTSCSPDFGVQGVLDRFGQTEPRLLICCDGYFYNGKTIVLKDRLEQLLPQLPTLTGVIHVPVIADQAIPANCMPETTLPVYCWQQQVSDSLDQPFVFRQFPFNHPLYILYSSGTTGAPKCIVHGCGGTLLQHLKEHRLHLDLQAGQRFFYFTTCGWMMWNWLASGLASGATLVLYDGSPFYPGPERLFDLIDQEQIAVFGTSAKYLSALEKSGALPGRSHRLDSLRTLLSTGSPLAPASFDYVYRDIKADVCLSSISGGTDIIACFALGNPLLPVYPGELQCIGLGMAVAIWNDQGQPLWQEKGELVCTQTFPSKPLGFWNDPDNNRFRAAYFSRFDNVWAHGDYAEITAHGGMVIHGRSDAVLNPGGVRIGTAEIYRQVETMPEILEALCIGQQWQDDVRVILFVVLRDNCQLTPALVERIRQTIRQGATPRHVPAKIIQVSALPRTRSGKLVEVAVRQLVHGEAIKNREAIANPEALAQFEQIPELKY